MSDPKDVQDDGLPWGVPPERMPAISQAVGANTQVQVAREAGLEAIAGPQDAPPERPPSQEPDLYRGIASAPFSREQAAILHAPTPPEIVTFKPAGGRQIGSVPQIEYRRRLDAAFGPGGWALRPVGAPQVIHNRLVFHGILYALGRFVSEAWGGCDFIPSNRQMAWDDALEGARSDCLKRACKDLGMFSEAWEPGWCDKVLEERGGKRSVRQHEPKDHAPKFDPPRKPIAYEPRPTPKVERPEKAPQQVDNADREALMAELRRLLRDRRLDPKQGKRLLDEIGNKPTEAALTVAIHTAKQYIAAAETNLRAAAAAEAAKRNPQPTSKPALEPVPETDDGLPF